MLMRKHRVLILLGQLVVLAGGRLLASQGWQLLFAYGHSTAGQAENYGYLELCKTWGNDDKDEDDQNTPAAAMLGGPLKSGR